jgi:hypothetical protein
MPAVGEKNKSATDWFHVPSAPQMSAAPKPSIVWKVWFQLIVKSALPLGAEDTEEDEADDLLLEL